ncbi:MAG: prolyl-tRNA synthetase associated domain-containing protein [Clostridia bacterium]|nr:prolyl-tRNA synthetase associated domain-containing protein [Clostridia bacterium]
MEDAARDALAFLDGLGIAYDLIHHESAASIEACRPLAARLGAPILKNLFLTTRRRGGWYLLVMGPDTPFRSGEVSRQAGTSRLCFAPEEPLWALLRERPGSISPMGLIFDTERQVTLLLDRALEREERLAFHPCVNTHSRAMATADFLNVFLPAVGRKPLWIDIDKEVSSPC